MKTTWETDTNKGHLNYDNSELFYDILNSIREAGFVFTNSTWKNDVCPSISAASALNIYRELKLFIDYNDDYLKQCDYLFTIILEDDGDIEEEYVYNIEEKEQMITTLLKLYNDNYFDGDI